MNDLFIESYRKFLDFRDNQDRNFGEFNYRNYNNKDDLFNGYWLLYFHQLNSYNDDIYRHTVLLIRCAQNLEAWSKVLDNIKNEDDKWKIILEFIEPLAITALILPEAISWKYTIALTNLSHSVNILKKPNSEILDSIPDDKKIKYNHLNLYCKFWGGFNDFMDFHSRLNSNEFKNSTNDFRRNFSHNFSRRIGVGFSYPITKSSKLKDGTQTYDMKEWHPLDIDFIANLINDTSIIATNTYMKFCAIIDDQIEHIKNAK